MATCSRASPTCARRARSSASCSTTTRSSRGRSTRTGRCAMPSAKFKFVGAIAAAALATWGCAQMERMTPGKGSVAEGRQVYAAKCVACHGADAKGGPVYGTMVGGIGSFTTNARVLTPGSMYPYAPILFDYIRRAMPMDRPQTLSADEVYAVSAYLLNLNGLVPGDAVMDAARLAQVQMPNRNGFLLDDRPDTKSLRCMSNCR